MDSGSVTDGYRKTSPPVDSVHTDERGQGLPDPIRVLIAEDDPSVRHSLSSTVASCEDLLLTGSAADTAEAIALGVATQPDVALIEVGMPHGGGIQVTEALRAGSPATRIVAVSGSVERSEVLAMLAAGATGFLVRGAATELVSALRAAGRGEGVLAREAAAAVIGELGSHLTRQKREEAERQRTAARVLDAIRGDLYTAFQPMFSLPAGTVAGHEALSRFRTDAARSPDRWFAEAWHVGLGFELEIAALQSAAAGAALLGPDHLLSVNLSPGALTDPRLGSRLEELPVIGRLVVEVTEHAVVDDYRPLVAVLERLRAAGARVAVDDAGAGYASLRHVLILRPDLVKLDRSLVAGIHQDPGKRALATGIITSAYEMGADVVAEGIETDAELHCVTGLGVRYAQGYHLGRPRLLDPCGDPRALRL